MSNTNTTTEREALSITLDGEELYDALEAVGEVNSEHVSVEIDTTGEEATCRFSALDAAKVIAAESFVTVQDWADDIEHTATINFDTDIDMPDEPVGKWFGNFKSALRYKPWTMQLTYPGEDADVSPFVAFYRVSGDSGWAFRFRLIDYNSGFSKPDIDHPQHVTSDAATARGGLFGIAVESNGAGVCLKTSSGECVATPDDEDNHAELPVGRSETSKGYEEAFYGSEFLKTIAQSSPVGDEWELRFGDGLPLMADVGTVSWILAPRLKGGEN